MTRPTKAALAALAVAGVLALAGCAGGQAGADASSSGAVDAEGVAHAQAQVDAHLAADGEGYIPTEPIPDLVRFAGSHVVYIPVAAQIPIFVNSYNSLKDALGTVGITVDLCDAKANPSAIAACLEQAVNTNAIGVVMEAVPGEMALDAYNSVVEAGIPIVFLHTAPPAGSPESVQMGGPDTPLSMRLAMDWIIAETGGEANVLAAEVIDNPTTEALADEARTELETYCPTCTMETVETKTADLQSLPSKVSAALLANSDVDYMFAQYSAEIQPMIQGAINAGRPDIPVVATTTTLGDLQSLAADNTPLAATVGYDPVRASWLTADQLLRLIAGTPGDASSYHDQPLRIFTADNVGELDVSDAGWASSDWFGGPGYQQQLAALWLP